VNFYLFSVINILNNEIINTKGDMDWQKAYWEIIIMEISITNGDMICNTMIWLRKKHIGRQ
jgi:hypothetical protein